MYNNNKTKSKTLKQKSSLDVEVKAYLSYIEYIEPVLKKAIDRVSKSRLLLTVSHAVYGVL